jgi:hypothetical protein
MEFVFVFVQAFGTCLVMDFIDQVILDEINTSMPWEEF